MGHVPPYWHRDAPTLEPTAPIAKGHSHGGHVHGHERLQLTFRGTLPLLGHGRRGRVHHAHRGRLAREPVEPKTEI